MNPAAHYILKQPEPYRSILLHLQVIIEHAIINFELKYKWSIPFYYVNGMPFCYLNASHKKQFVDLVFVKGNQLTVFKTHHVIENRKKMISLRYKSLDKIDDTVINAVLQEALTLQ
ncbi:MULTISPECIES: DUF1801 domain-containing protein [unclassified Olleya]|uniref:DUF1801 domain-containing protein n=1 Tax=unclassified Olleya TaxID=2615019 RepID=UPI00119F4CD7|nr:DUF1801 domain-containing protein [Olleya sp. Hel_I_94]TVZ47285.1 uncharacterized protein DUF1801 [Olleya sp. Hel_I_94]